MPGRLRRLSMLERLSSQGPLDPRVTSLLLIGNIGNGGGGGGGGITQLTGQVTAGPGSGSVAAKIAAQAEHTLYISTSGSDSTGNGNIYNPYATYAKCAAVATAGGASFTSPWVVQYLPGQYTENILLFAFVNIGGFATQFEVEFLGATMALDASFFVADPSNASIEVSDISIGSDVDIDFASLGGSLGGSVAFLNCSFFGSTFTNEGLGASTADLAFYSCDIFSAFSATDFNIDTFYTLWQGGGITLTSNTVTSLWESSKDAISTDVNITATSGFVGNGTHFGTTLVGTLTLDGADASWKSSFEGVGTSIVLSGGAAQPIITGSGNATSGWVPTADGSGNIVWAPSAGGGGLDQLTGDGTAGPGTGSQALTVVSMQTGLVTANVPVGSVQGGTLSGFRDSVAGTGYSLGQGASSSHVTALCFGYANLTGPPWVGTANYAIAGTNTDTYIAPAGGVNNNVFFGYDQSDTLFSMHMSAGGAGGNFQFGATQSFGGGAGVVGFQAATTQPSTNPGSGGAILWAHADGATGHSSLFFRDDQGNVYDLSAGSSGITALTGDVLASGSGSVAATVVQITGSSSVCTVINGTAITFLQTGLNVSTAGRLNFPGNVTPTNPLLATRNLANSADLPIVWQNGNDLFFGNFVGGNSTLYGNATVLVGNNALNALLVNLSAVTLGSNAATLSIPNVGAVNVTNSPWFFDNASNVTIGSTSADYGGATGLLSFAPATQPASLAATDVGLYATTSGQTLGLNGNGITFSRWATSAALTQTPLASTSGSAATGIVMSAVAQAGQAASGAANPGALGGALALAAGIGGASNGANAAGGTGGDVTVSGGAGGAAAGITSPGGNGGNAFLMGASGGTGTLSNGAIGGAGMGAAGVVYLSVGGPGGAGLGLVAKSIATTGGTLSLSAAQYLFGRLGINGTLAGALTIVFPNTTGLWLLDLTGLTTGAFTTITVQSGSASTTFVAGGPTAGVGQAHWIVTNGSNTLAVI
jgi:hypothetical protein